MDLSTDFNRFQLEIIPGSIWGHPKKAGPRHLFLGHPPEPCPLVESFGSIHGKTGTNNLLNEFMGEFNIFYGTNLVTNIHSNSIMGEFHEFRIRALGTFLMEKKIVV